MDLTKPRSVSPICDIFGEFLHQYDREVILRRGGNDLIVVAMH
jgi:hypothetical protein